MYKRMLGLFACMVLLFSGLVMRLYALTQTSQYSAAAEYQSNYILEIDSSRGMIYDVNFTPLVSTETSYRAAVLPTPEAATALIEQTEIISERQTLMARFEDSRPFLYDLSSPYIYSKGIDVYEISKRYTRNQIAPHVIGYVSSDGKGVVGIESAYEDVLSQYSGQLIARYSVDAGGRPLQNTSPEVMEVGYNQVGGVVLTIDTDIQEIAQNAADNNFDKGAVVVMDIETGELRAMVSTPSYDPNNIADYLNAENSPLINRTLWDYSVGSSFKTLVAATAIEQGYENFGYECKGYIQVGDTIFYCHNRNGHSWLNMRGALEKSCNPYFVSLVLNMGGESVLYKAEQIGLGKSSTLAPGITTASGSLPTYGDLAVPGEAANFAFGQGKLLATPIQIAQMISAIANGGYSVTPKLVVGTTADGQTIDEYTQTYSATQVMSARASVLVRDYMVSVVENGSGTEGRPYAMGAGGKTASAQTGQYDENGEELVHAWFVGFFPAQDPQYAIVVLAEELESGGDFAAPAFKEICDGILARDKVRLVD